MISISSSSVDYLISTLVSTLIWWSNAAVNSQELLRGTPQQRSVAEVLGFDSNCEEMDRLLKEVHNLQNQRLGRWKSQLLKVWWVVYR